MANPISGALIGFAGRLRFPALFGITATLFLVTLVVPDPIPFVDELLLGLGAMTLASLKRRREDAAARPVEAAPRERDAG
jgi:uncharacterized membrane protein YccC